jgi:tricorn protease
MKVVRPTLFSLALFALALPQSSKAWHTLDDPGVAPTAEPIRFMRDPHVAGDRIAFSYQGDIWVAARDGSSPLRLTNHMARDVAPRFSADGQWVAFSSDRFGSYDVWLVPVEGGEPTQLTFHTTNDMVAGWTPSGEIIFTSSRSTHPFLSPAYTVSPDGGLPEPMEMDAAAAAAVSPDGRYLAFNRIGVNTTRKGYKGNRAPDIYVLDRESGAITQITDTDLQAFREHVPDGGPMWGADGMLYFLSERNGTEATQVTRHEVGVKYPSMSPDGRTIIYTEDHELWTVDVPNGQPRKIPVSLAFDPTINRVEWVDVSNRAEGFSVHPDGKTLAVDSRGEIFLVPVDSEKGEKVQVTASAWRDRYQQYSPDGTQLAYVSDEGAREELWVANLGTGERRRISDQNSFMEGNLVWSPGGARITFEADNTIYEVEVATGDVRELAFHINRGFILHQYSPDGAWLLFGKRDLDENDDLYLFNVSSREELNVTRDPFRDRNGILTPDGTHLVFLSTRDGGTSHLFVAPLARLTEDPDDPLVRGKEEEEAGEDREGREGRGGENEKPAPEPLDVDAEGIENRVKQLSSGENGVGDFFLSADGETVYFNPPGLKPSPLGE